MDKKVKIVLDNNIDKFKKSKSTIRKTILLEKFLKKDKIVLKMLKFKKLPATINKDRL